jgi:hypothetical protein
MADRQLSKMLLHREGCVAEHGRALPAAARYRPYRQMSSSQYLAATLQYSPMAMCSS